LHFRLSLPLSEAEGKSAAALAPAFLVVIPEGNLRLLCLLVVIPEGNLLLTRLARLARLAPAL
jgi:hypothetical protein